MSRDDNPGFMRMFDIPATHFPRDALIQLGMVMAEAVALNPDSKNLPAGYTYLGQFIDHDITKLEGSEFLSHGLPKEISDLKQKVTPQLDLSSVYGKGFHDKDLSVVKSSGKFRLGCSSNSNGELNRKDKNDLPRGGSSGKQALIADSRNDENLILGQLHLKFLKLHNSLVEKINEYLVGEDITLTSEQIFNLCRANLLFYYHEIIVHDYLKLILNESVWNRYFEGSLEYTSEILNFSSDKLAIPVEFAGAAFRFSHAMIREDYKLNKKILVELSELFLLTGKNDLDGHLALPKKHLIEWERFFNGRHSARSGIVRSLPITPAVHVKLNEHSKLAKTLSVRDLIRGNELQLPSAQNVVKFLQKKFSPSLEIDELKPDELNPELRRYDTDGTLLKFKLLDEIFSGDDFKRTTPLWYYILVESLVKEKGRRVGKVGSIIIAETFCQLLKYSKIPSKIAVNDINFQIPTVQLFDHRSDSKNLLYLLKKHTK